MYQRLLFIDYLGVYNVMLWPQAYAIYWSLMCYPALRQLAFVVYFSVSAACIVLVIRAVRLRASGVCGYPARLALKY